MTEPKSAIPERRRRPRAPNSPPAANRPRPVPLTRRSSDVVRDALRGEIIAMSLPPGTPISEKDVAKRFGVSRTPVREALLRLAEERLVDVLPKSGTFVSRIPLSAVREAVVARKALEGATVRAVTTYAQADDIAGLRAIIERQQAYSEAGEEDAFHRADEEFHAALAGIANYPGIWSMIQMLKGHIDRYRRLSLPQPGRMPLIVAEHAAIVDAIVLNDPELAAARMAKHLDRLQLDIAIFRDLWPGYFIYDLTPDAFGEAQGG